MPKVRLGLTEAKNEIKRRMLIILRLRKPERADLKAELLKNFGTIRVDAAYDELIASGQIEEV